MGFCIVQGCPVKTDIGPYIAIVLNDAKAHVNSIYRGADAERLLNAHGKHSQRQLFDGWRKRLPGFLPANPPGFSSHELRSDGVVYPNVTSGHPLAWWQQGFDVNDWEVAACKKAAARYGWTLFQPYSSGSERHHLNFKVQPKRPKPGTKLWARLWRLRATLPRK